MKSSTRIASQLPKALLLALFLALAPAALATATWYFDGVNGNDSSDCLSSQTACKTIGHAISLCTSGDTIKVAPAIYTENLYIGINLKIIGSDAATTIVDGNQARVFFIPPHPKAHVSLSRLTIRNGYSPPEGSGGGIYNGGTLTINRSIISGNSGNSGGGIFSYNTLTVNNSTISGNSSWGGGGGINNQGRLTINNSTISGNSAAAGGGIYNSINNSYGTLTINNSTISGNGAAAGGGIYNGGTLTVNSSTISGNSAADNNAGGGIDNTGAVTLQNSIVANTLSGGNCRNDGTMTSNGYNLSSDNSCNFTGPGDMNNTKAKLGKLGNHGGPTQTIPLLPGSPAVDAGNPNGCTNDKGNLLKTDQRGRPRPDLEDNGVGCDIGAFERQND